MKHAPSWSRRIALGTLTVGLAACVAVTDDDAGEPTPVPEIGVAKERIFEPVSALSESELPDRALPGSGQLVTFNRQALAAGRVELVTAGGAVFTAVRQATSVMPGSETWGGEIEGHPGSDLCITELHGVHALRDQVGADVVALITEDTDSNWYGYGYIMRNNSAAFAKDAFSATKASCLANNTLAHEIGHNQGSHHDRETAAGAYGMYTYSYGLRRCETDDTGFRTIMAYRLGQKGDRPLEGSLRQRGCVRDPAGPEDRGQVGRVRARHQRGA